MKIGTIASMLLFGLSALSGCTAGQAGREEGAPVAQAGSGENAGIGLDKAGPPLTLTVKRIGSGTTVELLAVVTAVGRTPAPVVLKAIAGDDTFLEAGAESEDLGRLEPGSTVERKFWISGTAPKLEIRAVSRSKAAAATAVAFWPVETRPELPPPKAAPIPPVKIGGVVIREAIPLDPDGIPTGEAAADRGQ